MVEKAPGICADAVTRIPFLWRWPGRFPGGCECGQLAESVDVAPTLCALAGLPEMPTADGKDLTGLLEGGDRPVRDLAVTENAWSTSFFDGRYRYLHVPPALEAANGACELYDLREDPWEMRNLVADPEHAAALADMRKRALDWLLTSRRVATSQPSLDRQGNRCQKGRRIHPVDADGKRGPNYLAQVAAQSGMYM